VNDLERDLRNVLDEDARLVPTPISAPDGLRRSVRRRQAVFGGAVALAGLAIVAGLVAGTTTLLSLESGPKPAALGPKTNGTLNGITITYPQTWHLIDPDEAGLNGPDPTTVDLPRLILALSPTDPGDVFGCPGLAEGPTPMFLMTVQEEPLALAGSGSAPWPVRLDPMDVGGGESACYPGWEFLRAGWTASGRTFEARVGMAPEATRDERNALFAAFASMSFEPSKEEATSVVLTTGTAGGEEWNLTAARQVDGLSLTLNAESFGTGSGGYHDSTSDELILTSHVFGDGAAAERVVFGAVPEAVVRVEASWADGSVVSAEVLDVPNRIDPDLNAFVLVIAPDPVEFLGYDSSGEVVARGTVDAAEPPPFPGASLEDGRHFGYVRAVDADAGTIEFDLAYLLSGKEADRAYQEATGNTGHVPNDYFIVNDNPMLRTLVLAPDVRLRLLDWNHCCETFFDGDLALFAEAIGQQTDVTDGDLIYRGQSQWWITVENGVVTEIEEQYSP
jgi:hypothetical protein